jgi:protein-glutamine gamma-glutamyltransferase
MRFALTHKATTYALIGFAYLAMTAGGELSPMISILGGLGLVISWWWEPPVINPQRWAWIWTGASILVLGYSVLSAIATADYLRVGGEFLVWLVVAKACHRITARDWLQLYLLAFLMLVAGSVLNADLTYGLCFLGFVITSTWALTLFQLRREMEDSFLLRHTDDQPSERVQVRRILESRRIVGGRFLFGTAALSLGVFLGAAALFLALPRVGFGFLGGRRGGLSMAGFSDGVQLGGHGVIKRDATVVMRVEMASAWGDRNAASIHWRGVAFDRYSRGNWSRSRSAPTTKSTVSETGVRRDRRKLLYDKARGDAALIERMATAVKQNIYLDPLDTDVLFGASMPAVFETDTVLRPARSLGERNDEVRLPRNGTIHYQVWSSIVAPGAEVLRSASDNLPNDYQVYLQLPPEITERTRALARQITAAKTTTYDRAVALRDWLTANLTYTLEQVDPKEQEAVDFFLFTRKKGHCEYFASAFVVLARAVGIPARNVNGFLGGEWNEYNQYVAVRAGDAHSWAEVYFGAVGWVTFDATPPGQIDELGRGAAGSLARLQRFMDTLRFQWTKWVIEYDLGRQISVFRGVGSALKSAATTAKKALGVAWDQAKRGWPLAVLAGLGATLWWVRRGWRRRWRSGAGTQAHRALSPVADALLDAERALARRGWARDSSTTPREHAESLRRRDGPGADLYHQLVELHQTVVWGRQLSTDHDDRAAELAAQVRSALEAAARIERGRRRGAAATPVPPGQAPSAPR